MTLLLSDHLVVRFASDQRVDALEQEQEAIKDLQDDLEEFIFMEETATKVMAKARKLGQKYPDLAAMSAAVQDGLNTFHNRVLNELSEALEQLDEADSRCVEELDSLLGR